MNRLNTTNIGLSYEIPIPDNPLLDRSQNMFSEVKRINKNKYLHHWFDTQLNLIIHLHP